MTQRFGIHPDARSEIDATVRRTSEVSTGIKLPIRITSVACLVCLDYTPCGRCLSTVNFSPFSPAVHFHERNKKGIPAHACIPHKSLISDVKNRTFSHPVGIPRIPADRRFFPSVSDTGRTRPDRTGPDIFVQFHSARVTVNAFPAAEKISAASLIVSVVVSPVCGS